jgi:hypothetical protein
VAAVRDDDLAACVPGPKAAESLGGLGERVHSIDDGADLSGLDHAGEGREVGPVLVRDEDRESLADEGVEASVAGSISRLAHGRRRSVSIELSALTAPGPRAAGSAP